MNSNIKYVKGHIMNREQNEPEIGPLPVEPSFPPSVKPEQVPIPGPRINPNPEKAEPVKILPEVQPDP